MKRLLICVLALGLLAGCAPASVQEQEDGKLHIVATVFPAYDFARAAAGDLADVELLLPPGTESHSYEPTPADILKVQSCDLFLYLGGDSDQWVETILEAAEPTGRTLALIDCVETLEEEHVEGMQEEVGHHHDEDEHDHDHHHHHHDGEECDDPHCGCHHHHHHADEVFTSWGTETVKAYSEAELEHILTALDSGEYGAILRAKGIVAAADGGQWLHYDFVPEEHQVRRGPADYTGRICVIGSQLKEDKLSQLFGL